MSGIHAAAGGNGLGGAGDVQGMLRPRAGILGARPFEQRGSLFSIQHRQNLLCKAGQNLCKKCAHMCYFTQKGWRKQGIYVKIEKMKSVEEETA